MMNVKINTELNPFNLSLREMRKKPFSYSFSPKTEEMFEEKTRLYRNSLPIEKREAKGMEKKVGKERGKRGKGKGCE